MESRPRMTAGWLRRSDRRGVGAFDPEDALGAWVVPCAISAGDEPLRLGGCTHVQEPSALGESVGRGCSELLGLGSSGVGPPKRRALSENRSGEDARSPVALGFSGGRAAEEPRGLGESVGRGCSELLGLGFGVGRPPRSREHSENWCGEHAGSHSAPAPRVGVPPEAGARGFRSVPLRLLAA